MVYYVAIGENAMAYEVFTRKIIRTGSPTVSVSRLGRIGLNQSASHAMEITSETLVLLLWDKEHKKIAIKKVTNKDARAYRITLSNKSSGFSAKTFLDYIGYDYSQTRSFPAEWNEQEKMLEVQLPNEALTGIQKSQIVAEDGKTKAKKGK
jgi:hypothetical protein